MWECLELFSSGTKYYKLAVDTSLLDTTGKIVHRWNDELQIFCIYVGLKQHQSKKTQSLRDLKAVTKREGISQNLQGTTEGRLHSTDI